MSKVLYLGNQLSKHGFTPTSVETLGNKLNQIADIRLGSSIRNKRIRLLHMWWLVLKYRHVNYLILDTYSTSAFLFAWSSARLAFWLGIKYIPILRGGGLPDLAQKNPKKLGAFLKDAFKVVTPSGYLKAEMRKICDRDYELIPNYIEIKDYQYTERLLSRDRVLKILWVRSFDQIYHPTLAVKLLDALNKLNINTELCMVGPDKDGSMQHTIDLARELGVVDRLKVTGKLAKADWIELSKEYGIFLNTTNVDNTPVSVIEAMALGLPVVTTDVGGIPYLIDHQINGITVPPNDLNALTDAVVMLLDCQTASQLASAARKKVEAYDWEVVKSKWFLILSDE